METHLVLRFLVGHVQINQDGTKLKVPKDLFGTQQDIILYKQ